MASLEILDRTGKKVGSYDIDPAVFSSHINRQLLHDVVVMYQANQRQGTMKTKSRGQVAGTGKKMYRQKGTGNARAGGRRSPVRVGGGHTFRKDPREFRYALPRKAVQLATRMAIASKIRDNQVTVIDDLKFDAPRTKDMAALIKAVKCDGGSLLVGVATTDVNVYKSTRNIDKVEIAPVKDFNAYSVLLPKRLLLTKAALDALKESAEKTPKSRNQLATAPQNAEPV
jgi:large subunit ribosomal protein L4